MITVTLSLSDQLREWIEDRAKAHKLDDARDYVVELIRRDRDRANAVAEVQALLNEGFASGVSERTIADITEDARTQARAKLNR